MHILVSYRVPQDSVLGLTIVTFKFQAILNTNSCFFPLHVLIHIFLKGSLAWELKASRVQVMVQPTVYCCSLVACTSPLPWLGQMAAHPEPGSAGGVLQVFSLPLWPSGFYQGWPFCHHYDLSGLTGLSLKQIKDFYSMNHYTGASNRVREANAR